jgi:glycosyltransferase involved in cell wall biosynthesis
MIVGLLVTRDSERWIEQTLLSVQSQTRPADRIVIVDDHSTDGTHQIAKRILGESLTWVESGSDIQDVTTRVAQNFSQGLAMCDLRDTVILGDHDDVWNQSRIEHQMEVMDQQPSCIMLASNGEFINVEGKGLNGRLRDVFPVPSRFNEAPPQRQLAYTLHHSIATGGASAIRPAGLRDRSKPPQGWLHDRWWSVVAVVQGGMIVDDVDVIRYRVQPSQIVGLNRGQQDLAGVRRMASSLGQTVRNVQKIREVSQLRSLSDNVEMHRALSVPHLLVSALRAAPVFD